MGRVIVKRLCLLRILLILLLASTTHAVASAKPLNFVESDVVRDIAYIPMHDGTRIAYISYRPKNGRYPTVLMMDPYQGSASTFDTAKPYLDAGYAFVGANITATGCSEGVIDHWLTRIEGVHGAEVVEWIARQRWSDGRIGMVGNSSAGTVQLRVAAERPPHLKAIVPAGIGDGYANVFYLGGMMQPSLAAWAINAQFGAEKAGAEWRVAHSDTECLKIRGSGRQIVKEPMFNAMRGHAFKDAWWDTTYPALPEDTAKISVPTMIVAAIHDEYGGATRESTQLFRTLLKNVRNKRLVMMNGSHGSGDPLTGYGFIHADVMRFLDRWVRDKNNGIDSEPPIKIFWEVATPAGDLTRAVPGWTTSHESWPDPAVRRTTRYLSADSTLLPETSGLAPKQGTRAYLYPTGSELTGNDAQFAVNPFPSGILSYRTAPMSEDMSLFGNPQLHLWFSVDSGTDTDFAVTLKDVAPDGTVLYLQSGVQRASFREIDQTSTYDEEIVHTYKEPEYIVPGKVYELRLSLLGPIAHVVRKGHKLELTIGAPSPTPHQRLGSVPTGTTSINRIYQSPVFPSKLILPVLPGAIARAPAPACGTLVNQPCRRDDSFESGGLPIP